MANEINIGINTTSNLDGINQVDQSVKSLKTQLKEAQANVAALSDTFGATSKQAVEAAKSAAMLKDKIGDAKALTDAFNPDAKFKAVSASLTGVAGGFSAVTGAMGLFGAESKDVEQAILKVQSAMALASGIQALGESADAFNNVKVVAVNAFKAIKGAIGATGIGLLVIALGTIVAYWDDIKGAVSGVSEEQKKLNKATEDNLKSQKSKLDTINSQDATLKLQGKSEREILKIKIAATKEVFNASKTQLENNIATTKAQVDASKRNKEILRGTLEFLTAPLALLLETIDSVGEALGKDFGLKEGLYEGIAKMVFNPEEVQKEANKVIEEQKLALVKLQNDMDSYELQRKEIDKKANEAQVQRQTEKNQKIAENQKIADDKAKSSKEFLEKQKKEIEDIQANSEVKRENLRHERQVKEIEDTIALSQRKAAIENEELIHTQKINEAKVKDQESLNALMKQQAEDEYQQSINFINLEDAGYEDSLEKKLAHYEHLLTIQEDYGKSTVEIDKQIAETKKQIDAQEIANKTATIDAVGKMAVGAAEIGNFIADRLKDSAGQDKGRQKTAVRVGAASSIAGVIGSTASANAGFLANPASIATMGLAAAVPIATNIASSLVAVANIISQKNKAIAEIDNAGGGDSSGGKATPSKFATGGLVQGMGTSTSDSIMASLSNGESVINAKSTAMFGNLLSNINQMGGGVSFGNQSQANPIFKTYVVASEMTSQIEANLKLKQIARL